MRLSSKFELVKNHCLIYETVAPSTLHMIDNKRYASLPNSRVEWRMQTVCRLAQTRLRKRKYRPIGGERTTQLQINVTRTFAHFLFRKITLATPYVRLTVSLAFDNASARVICSWDLRSVLRSAQNFKYFSFCADIVGMLAIDWSYRIFYYAWWMLIFLDFSTKLNEVVSSFDSAGQPGYFLIKIYAIALFVRLNTREGNQAAAYYVS